MRECWNVGQGGGGLIPPVPFQNIGSFVHLMLPESIRRRRQHKVVSGASDGK